MIFSQQVSSQASWPSFQRECSDTLKLALPLIAGQLGQMLMGVADTVMIGRLGVTQLAAATFAHTILIVPFVLGIGLLTSISVRVSQAHGARNPYEAQEALRHGTALALFFGLLVVAASVLTVPFLGALGQPREVIALSSNYILIFAISLIPALLSMAWKNHSDALNQPWMPFWIFLGGVMLNVGLAWLWIYGRWGFPAFGLEGAASATLVARIATVVVLFAWLRRSVRIGVWWPRKWLKRFHYGTFRDLLAIGIPASLQLLTEVTAFAAASLIIGTLGVIPLAAHQVALTCAATTFMVPLGVGMAITVRVGQVVGARQHPRLRRVLLGGWLYALAFMGFAMIAFLLNGRWIAARFIGDPATIKIAAVLLVVGGLFQLFDGLQVVSAGALRGINDVRVPAWLALIAYWGVALPMGAFLALAMKWGAPGMWTGLAFGLAVAATTLGRRAWRMLNGSDGPRSKDTPQEALPVTAL